MSVGKGTATAVIKTAVTSILSLPPTIANIPKLCTS